MKKSVLLAGAVALTLSASSAFAQDAMTGSSTSNPGSPAANSGTSQTGPGDGMGSMSGSTSQYQSNAAGQQALPDQGNAPDNRKNTDYGTLEPGLADTNPGTNMPSTTRNADTTETRLPLKGANSFTEAEATRRLQGAGYTQISGLAKDDQSVWRGTAMKGDSQVSVALDYRGNITDQQK